MEKLQREGNKIKKINDTEVDLYSSCINVDVKFKILSGLSAQWALNTYSKTKRTNKSR